jgi:hypothetical protein
MDDDNYVSESSILEKISMNDLKDKLCSLDKHFKRKEGEVF